MKLLKKLKFKWVILFSLILPLIFFFSNIYYWEKKAKKIEKEYPTINTSDNFKGILISKENIIRGDQVKMVLKNDIKFILLHSKNDAYLPKNKLSEFIQIGDSISKKSGTDSVFVYRNDNVYSFIISKRIDKSGNFY